MKVWQNKSKGAKKAAKSKKKKLTKKKPVSQQQVKGDKAKQANGNVAGSVSGQSQFSFLSECSSRFQARGWVSSWFKGFQKCLKDIY